MRYISIDTETTGTDPDKDQVLEIGAIIEDTENPLPFEEVPKFNLIIKHDRYQGQARAIHMNMRIFEILMNMPEPGTKDYHDYVAEHHIVSKESAAHHFLKWLSEHGIKHDTMLIGAGKNIALFDIPFLNNLPNWKRLVNIGRTIDPGQSMLNWKTDTNIPNSKECKERAGLKETEYQHNALIDAWEMILILRTKYT